VPTKQSALRKRLLFIIANYSDLIYGNRKPGKDILVDLSTQAEKLACLKLQSIVLNGCD
jgi:hypothetical protein